MRFKECEAEIHHENCPCIKCQKVDCRSCNVTNIDHFTPRCVIKKNHNKFRNNKENLQWLSRACHRMKDRSTPARKQRRVFRTLDELRAWRNEHDLILK